MRQLRHRLALVTGLLALPGAALAHHPMGGEVPSTLWHGLASGLAHPVIGPDHLAFLLAIGLVAGLAGWGLARPMLFVLASLAGVAAAWLGLLLPAVEWIVAATVLAAGAALLAGRAVPVAAWMALLAVAGIAHGQAYAAELLGAEATPILGYLIGLAVVQGALVALVAWLARQVPGLAAGPVPRLVGAAVLAVGVFALV
ncbi:urease accessory protein UreJ [Roseomonas frigidaquae]|uniref:Urease accessory protein UreJ n=1 Tax=Falsiroseomonas frigidaquae TaxID=487318 RepID=A0ABX1F1H5_9PROT|nr:HupE/UreJ family protein [Falsiroseomonas frigidaquae]NKE46158.1 urease accessory protein UreJ [Falsiroseomonas frigidaquae]